MMKEENNLPRTLQEAIRFFSDDLFCVKFVASRRWQDGVAICPQCASANNTFMESRKVWQCKNKECKKQFSVKVGTIFEDSPISLDKWLTAIWLVANCKNSVSSYEIHRTIGITQKSAWFLLHRIRLAMQNSTLDKFSGEVEADETFVGGKAKNMPKHKREQKIQGRGSVGKTAVMGLLERKGNEQFLGVLEAVSSKRLTYDELRGIYKPSISNKLAKRKGVKSDSTP